METGARLYNLFLSGDGGALEELVRLYSDDLVRFACLFVVLNRYWRKKNLAFVFGQVQCFLRSWRCLSQES